MKNECLSDVFGRFSLELVAVTLASTDADGTPGIRMPSLKLNLHELRCLSLLQSVCRT